VALGNIFKIFPTICCLKSYRTKNIYTLKYFAAIALHRLIFFAIDSVIPYCLIRYMNSRKNIDKKRSVSDDIFAVSVETNKLEAIYQQKLADVDELKKAILQKAFNGELTGVCS
jgi:hypothetical protein